MLPEPFWTSAEQVAKQAVDGLAKGKRVVVPGLFNRAGAIGGQHVPRSLMLPLVGARLQARLRFEEPTRFRLRFPGRCRTRPNSRSAAAASRR